SFRPGGPIPDQGQKGINAVEAYFDQLSAQQEDLARVRRALFPRVRDAIARVLEDVTADVVAAARAGDAGAAHDAARRAAEALLEAHDKDPNLLLLDRNTRDEHLLLATAHAARAASSSLVVASSAGVASSVAVHAHEFEAWAGHPGGADNVERVKEIG